MTIRPPHFEPDYTRPPDVDRDGTRLVAPASIAMPERRRGWPCLAVPDGQGQPPFLVLRPEGNTIGRSAENDMSLEGHDMVSRRHVRVLSDGHAWIVEDLGSSNGTLLDGEPVASGASAPLRDGAQLVVGGVALVFYSPDGVHREIVRRAVEDPTTGLLRREVLLSSLRRVLRERRECILAAFDIDGYADLCHRLDHVTGREILARYGAALREVAAERAPHCIVAAQVVDDTAAMLLDTADWGSEAAWLERTRERLSRCWPEGESISVSAALLLVNVPRGMERDAQAVLDRAEQKLRQVKLAGGNRSTASRVLPMWDRRNEERWRSRLDVMKVVALGWPATPAGTSAATQDRVRQTLASAIDALPPETSIAIAWRPAGGYWFIAADCAREPLEAALAGIPELTVAFGPTGADAFAWIANRLAQLDLRPHPTERPLSFAVAQLFDEYRSSEPRERFEVSHQAFEALLRFVGNILVAALAWQRAEVGPAEHDGLVRDPGLHAIQHYISRPVGAGSWLRLVGELWRHVRRELLPPSFVELMASGWMDRAQGALAHRNQGVHQRMGEAWKADVAERIWTRVRELGEALPASELRMVFVTEADPIYRRVGWSRIRALHLAGALPPEPTEHEVEAVLTQGLWLQTESGWIPLGPLLVYERGTSERRRDVYTARAFPVEVDRIQLAGTIYGATFEVDVSRDNPDFRTLVRDVRAQRPDDEPTGLYRFADLTSPGDTRAED